MLDHAEVLIMTRGYNAFSYHDLARALDLTTASVHYHFPKKADLGVAAVRRYASRISAGLDALAHEPDPRARLDAYLSVFMGVSLDHVRICLCGSLGAEFATLPQGVQSEVQRFFDVHSLWLGELLATGRENGAFSFPGDPAALGRFLFAGLEGALIVARGRRDPEAFALALQTVRELVGAVEPPG
ncbi:MAG: TetR/AcrR family transcriptional regulator [Myxococcota bacterium]